MSIQVKVLTYSPTIIYGLAASPTIVLPAPATGYINNILGITHQMTYGGTKYLVATSIIYNYDATNNQYIFLDTVTLPATSSINSSLKKTLSNSSIFSTISDITVTTDLTATTGNSTVTAYIIYETVKLDPTS